MHPRKISKFASSLIFAVAVLAAQAHAAVPDWLRALAQQPAKSYANDVNAVVLLDAQEITIKEGGDILRHERIAIRILRPEGKGAGQYVVPYDNETKLNYLRGWSITTKGVEYETKNGDTYEVGITPDEVFSDSKMRYIKVPGADVGTIVGYEFEQRQRPYVFQDNWSFQDSTPVERARYELHFPAGWEYRTDWVNYAAKEPTASGSSYLWELTDIPRIEREPNQPPRRAVAGRMLTTFYAEKIKSRAYRNWNEIGVWYNSLSNGSRAVTPEIQQKAAQLAPASMPLWERIAALSHFAQHDIRYAAIEIGIGGFKPHNASEIFAHKYGDCKDKATLLGALLQAIGVKSYYVVVHTDRGIYTEKSPPDVGFNHMIIAIQLSEGSFTKPMPAMYEHAKLGHLLIFDPTSEWEPLGQLPPSEQDNFGLLVTDDGGELIHLPASAPEINKITRTAKLTLLPDGTLTGEATEIRSGAEAAASRYAFVHETQADRKKALEQMLGGWITSFQLDSVDAENLDKFDADLVLKYKFTASHYAKNAGPLLLVRPRVLGEKAGRLEPKPRHYDYELAEQPTLQTDTFEITLPAGYTVDELPDPADAHFAFGEYKSKFENSGNILKYTREYKVTSTSVPVDKISDLKRFFGEIVMDEKNMAVLKKSN